MQYKQPPRGRRDHYLPVGYLKGFESPERQGWPRPIWAYSPKFQNWRSVGAKEIGYEFGLYDFANDAVDAEHTDVTFKMLEDRFPVLRRELVATNFGDWTKHLDFLRMYMQMIRLRSPLYMHQTKDGLQNTRIHQVTGVDPETNSVTLDDMRGRPLTEAEKHDHTLSLMRQEFNRGIDWMQDFHWTLRVTYDPNDPVISGDQPLAVRADGALEAAMGRADTWLFFPLCWQACLVGNRIPWERDIEPFPPDKLRVYRRTVVDFAQRFIVSPTKLAF